MSSPCSAFRTVALRTLVLLTFLFFTSDVPLSAADGPKNYLGKKYDSAWFASAEGARIAANIRSHQAESGGWPKNGDTASKPFEGNRDALKATFDNGATRDELRFLARRAAAADDSAARDAFSKGLDYILEAQYENGGWPQFHPPGSGYHKYVTFNDGTMVGLMEFLREVAREDRYAFVPQAKRDACRAAFDRGVACILKCQIREKGVRTAWCAQHDEKDFSPRPARTFELASASGGESVGIARLLMSLESPTAEVGESVECAVAWLKKVRISGIREVLVPDAAAPDGHDKVVVADPAAPPLWARFYELGTDRPIFVDRDGLPKYSLAEIGHERRNGYAWYVSSASSLLEKDYPTWKRRHSKE